MIENVEKWSPKEKLGFDSTLICCLVNLSAKALRADVAPGTITLWFGILESTPPGWEVCDGENGTPKLEKLYASDEKPVYYIMKVGGGILPEQPVRKYYGVPVLISRGKPAKIDTPRLPFWQNSASRVVDGIPGTCASTITRDVPGWELDFEGKYVVTEVIVTIKKRYPSIVVLVNREKTVGAMCHLGSIGPGATSYSCMKQGQGPVGIGLALWADGRHSLELCEVEVYGYNNAWEKEG